MLSENDLGVLTQALRLPLDLPALRQRCKRAHAHFFQPGVTDNRTGELGANGLHDIGGTLLRHQRAPDGGALLTGLDGHFSDDFAHEEIELRRSGNCVGTEDRRVQRVRFGRKPHGMCDDGRMCAQRLGSAGGAGE